MPSQPPSENITDPKTLRALSHPTRWSLIELLGMEATATATRCAEYTDESVASCSYHLNMLAKYGFVEQAGGGRGREKPWRLVKRDQSWQLHGHDTETAMAAETLTELFLDHETASAKEWIRRSSREPDVWREAAGMTGRTLRMTPEELIDVGERISALLQPYRDRNTDPSTAPEGARIVRVLLTSWLPDVT